MPRLHAPKLFMDAAAVGPHGIIQADIGLVAAERRLIERAEQLILLVESSKFPGHPATSSVVLRKSTSSSPTMESPRSTGECCPNPKSSSSSREPTERKAADRASSPALYPNCSACWFVPSKTGNNTLSEHSRMNRL